MYAKKPIIDAIYNMPFCDFILLYLHNLIFIGWLLKREKTEVSLFDVYSAH